MDLKNTQILLLIIIGILPFCTHAKRYWPEKTLTKWSLYMNNGVAYIRSDEFASHCSYSRGQINMDGTEFNRAQYSYALSAKARNKKLRYVVDSDQTVCIITGLQEVD